MAQHLGWIFLFSFLQTQRQKYQTWRTAALALSPFSTDIRASPASSSCVCSTSRLFRIVLRAPDTAQRTDSARSQRVISVREAWTRVCSFYFLLYVSTSTSLFWRETPFGIGSSEAFKVPCCQILSLPPEWRLRCTDLAIWLPFALCRSLLGLTDTVTKCKGRNKPEIFVCPVCVSQPAAFCVSFKNRYEDSETKSIVNMNKEGFLKRTKTKETQTARVINVFYP